MTGEFAPEKRYRYALFGRRAYAIATAGIVAAAGLTLMVAVVPVPYRQLGEYGYLGVFAVTLLATAAVVVPVPYVAAIIVAGSYLNPFLVAVVAGVASAVGELTGYGAGFAGRTFVPHTWWTNGLEGAMRRYGFPVLFAASVLPNPLFDAIGLMAGATRTPLLVFLGACFLGKTIRFWALAALGTPLLGSG
ncbi:MAG: VTT domain-containing protein [Chloroflexi bacterium]|nr:VTT domain-containing protein [Chloroflexota bacterium]